MKFFEFFNPIPKKDRKPGLEYPDPTPIEKPVRFNRPGSTLEEIRRNLDARVALLSRQQEELGHETLEDSQDFDVGEDDEPISIHELRAHAANMSPEELYEGVFRKRYVPPAPPVGPRTPASDIPRDPPGDLDNGHPTAKPSQT